MAERVCVSVILGDSVDVGERVDVSVWEGDVPVGVADGDTATCDGVHDGDAPVESEADGERVAGGVADAVPVGSSL